MTTVLVIEDEAQTREIFVQCLTFEGFRAIAAENGMTGIHLAQTQRPDVIVCDIMMPDVDGYHVLAAVRRERAIAAVPFIFLTAKVTMGELRQGMELGADDYLTKPCTVAQFLAAIAARLQRQAFWREGGSGREEFVPTVASEERLFPDCPRLAAMFAFIEAHYHEAIGLAEVARAMGYSPAYLTHLTQELTGQSVKRWITERRMLEARSRLGQTDAAVKQIAEAIGYGDVGHFTRQFRQWHGVPPQHWRRLEAVRSA